ncbi:hypothetical protein [Pseudotenacibaculum haliotis]|uniref:Uncharacterized protein n=1 Tax=Pseudotenacibaculum haliotis TaxID=1862138 RepID=A0ABW5LSJ9_9FLAO
MSKYKNLTANTSQNFILRGLNSIQVGLYILLGAYLIKSSLLGFISDVSLMGMMSIQIIEIMSISVVILVFLFSSLAIYFSSRRNARRSGHKVWNAKSKKHFWLYFLLISVGIILLKIIENLGSIHYLTPAFLIYFSAVLFLLNTKKKKPYYILAGINLFLAALVLLIPSYWYSALTITGAGFLVYGIMVRK